MPLLVAAKYSAQDFFRQPAVQQFQLEFVIHMLQVVVQNRYIPNAFFNHISSNVDQCLSPRLRLFFSSPANVSSKCKAEQVLHLMELLSRQRHPSILAKQQSQMPECPSRCKSGIG